MLHPNHNNCDLLTYLVTMKVVALDREYQVREDLRLFGRKRKLSDSL